MARADESAFEVVAKLQGSRSKFESAAVMVPLLQTTAYEVVVVASSPSFEMLVHDLGHSEMGFAVLAALAGVTVEKPTKAVKKIQEEVLPTMQTAWADLERQLMAWDGK